MGSSANDLVGPDGLITQSLSQIDCSRGEDFDACGLPNRLCVEELLIGIFGATGAAKSAYRDVMFALGCLNRKEDYDRLLGAIGRRR